MAIKIIKSGNKFLLNYSPYTWIEYIEKELNEKDSTRIKKTFNVWRKDLLEIGESEIIFTIGLLENDYYVIPSRILETDFDVLFFKDYNISIKDFIVNYWISILPKIEKLANQQIVIWWDRQNIIPEDAYNKIIESFPTDTEIKHYKDARITNVISEYLEWIKDSNDSFEKYLSKRKKIDFIDKLNSFSEVNKYEYEKYSFILNKLNKMLEGAWNFTEKQWEKEILKIILLIFPKYIHSFSSCSVVDFYWTMRNWRDREIDFILLDTNWYLDIIEIKKPSESDLITKKPYFRGNYTPLKPLTGAIMQVEKYLFHLNKWWIDGERKLSDKYGINIKIASPKGFLILWRSNNLTKQQKFDFEIIKRKYANILDIITYDDLIERLENILEKFK